MASKFLLTLKLTTQGNVKGSSTRKDGDLDFSKGMECHGFNYEVATPVDSSSGSTTGRRTHNPIRITREVDSASPKLLQALVTNEVFRAATLHFNRANSDGKPSDVRTIELTNGKIADIKPSKDASGKRCEDVTLVYEGLLVNGIPDGIIPYSMSA
jgi:type VI secretion system secreted protein Hcp